jgi:hypothetical protein
MWKQLLILPSILLLSNCGPGTQEERVVLQTEYLTPNIPIQPSPDPVIWNDVDWYVVNEDNLDQFLERINNDAGNVVFFAITPQGYENLAIGIGELRRYVLQQQEIIAYYENAVSQDTVTTRADGPSDPAE